VITPRYLDELHLVKAGDKWRLTREFRFDSAVWGARIIVEPGLVTDLASVPRAPLAYWIAGGTAEAASVLHDWAYRLQLAPRAKADALFLEAMETDGRNVGIPPVPAWRRRLMYAAVRAFGERSWQEHR